MNTKGRPAKRQDIIDAFGQLWNKNLERCIMERGYSRETFAMLYKHKYGTGNTTDVYRWLNVGNMYGSAGKRIGFPSFDTMKRIADFFGVSVGYLVGETDFQTFDMERACRYLGIDESAGSAIRVITNSGKTSPVVLAEEHTAALNCILSADSFKNFISVICECAASIDKHNNLENHYEKVKREMPPDLFALAFEWRYYDGEMDIPDAPEPTPEFLDAIHSINDAIDEDFHQSLDADRDIKVAKYSLYEGYMRLIDEVICEKNMVKLVGIANMKVSSVADIIRLLERRKK